MTHTFGFESVSASEKNARVRRVFEEVAPRYDVMNDVMSAGLHRLWKQRFVAELHPRDGSRILDMSAGTGDITHRLFRAATNLHIFACDPSLPMLSIERARALDLGITQGIWRMVTRAEATPFPDHFFDYYTIAFGLRNVTERAAALIEAHRVLKPGGRLLILEFSPPSPGWFQKCYDAYSFSVIPKLGKLLTNDEASYRYLVESIRTFPPADALSLELTHAGFARARHDFLSAGIVAIHSGWKV